MNRNKATHIGSCQACGNVQKLPGGRLSLHGYDVRWHFFNGVCRGAKELPYEQSFDLIEKFIEQAQDNKTAVEAQIEQLNQPNRNGIAWVHEYYEADATHRSGYRWRQAEIIQEQKPLDEGRFYTVEYYVDHKEKHHRIDRGYNLTIWQVADILNAVYIKQVLQPRVDELTRYIGWQKQRIAEWKLTDLTPVPPVVPPDPNRKVRMRRRWR